VTHSILLVDADSEHRAHIARSLAEAGIQVAAEAASPEEAMRIAAAHAPDTAILTAALGNGGDMHLADRLSGEYGVPVVLLAPAAGLATLTLAAQSGVMGFLIEPVTPVALRTTLEVAVCRFREFRTLRQETQVLRQSIEARKVIERAKGLLMEGGRLSEREAYARIRRKSMDTQRPMTEIARAIILSAEVSMTPH
jgi:AmiR/NasT family two-component response regulator